MSGETPPVLECRDVTVRFGGVQALTEASFTVRPGRVAALIGPNGAGKTTLLNVASGMVPPTSGRILLSGRDVTAAQAHVRAGLGMVRTFQNLEVFTNMTALENVMTGCHRLGGCTAWDSLFKTPRHRAVEKRFEALSREALEFVGLSKSADSPAGSMPYGDLRLLEMARALVSRPSLLLLDEPAAGLNIKETRELGDVILRARTDLGVAVALVEHDMELVMRVSDDLTVLCFGRVIAEGGPADIQSNPEVRAAYLGEEDDEFSGAVA